METFILLTFMFIFMAAPIYGIADSVSERSKRKSKPRAVPSK